MSGQVSVLDRRDRIAEYVRPPVEPFRATHRGRRCRDHDMSGIATLIARFVRRWLKRFPAFIRARFSCNRPHPDMSLHIGEFAEIGASRCPLPVSRRCECRSDTAQTVPGLNGLRYIPMLA